MHVHDILTASAALAAVIGMILLARFGSRFAGLLGSRSRLDGILSLEASLALDPKRRLCLIGVRGHQVLLLTGGATDVLLGWLPPVGPTADHDR